MQQFKNYIMILALVLAVQAGIFGLSYVTEEKNGLYTSKEPLLTAQLDTATKIVIEDRDKKSIEVIKNTEGQWQVPSKFNFSASKEKIDSLVKAFQEQKKSWPAGKTDVSAKQFKTDQDTYERKISFLDKDQKSIATILIGSSPTFKKVYARVDGQKDIYTIEFNTFDYPFEGSEWVDRNALKVDRAAVKSVDFSNFTVEQHEGQLALTGLGQDETTDAAKASQLVNLAIAPTFQDVVSEGHKPEGSVVLTYKIQRNNADPLTFTIYAKAPTGEQKAPAGTDEVFIVADHVPFTFKTFRSSLDTLLHSDRGTLVKKENKAQEPAHSG